MISTCPKLLIMGGFHRCSAFFPKLSLSKAAFSAAPVRSSGAAPAAVTAHMHSPLQLICLCSETCMCKPCTWHSSTAICSTVSRAQTARSSDNRSWNERSVYSTGVTTWKLALEGERDGLDCPFTFILLSSVLME